MRPSFTSPNMLLPADGTRILPYPATMNAAGLLSDDLTEEMQNSQINMVQSVYIDNSLGAAPFRIMFAGIDPDYTIQCGAFQQGWYPVVAPVGTLRFSCQGTPGETTPLQFCNSAMPYYSNGPQDGNLVVPSLTPLAVDFNPMAIGDNILIAGQLGKSIRLYRALLSSDLGAELSFTDGPGGALLCGPLFMYAGGSLTFQAAGTPWITASSGNDLIIASSAASRLGGIIGYTQI